MRVRRYEAYTGNDFLSVINTDKYETIDANEVKPYLANHPDKFCISNIGGSKVCVFPGNIVYFDMSTPSINGDFFKDIIFLIQNEIDTYYLYKDGTIIEKEKHKMARLNNFYKLFSSTCNFGYKALVSDVEEWRTRAKIYDKDRPGKADALEMYPQYFKIKSACAINYNRGFTVEVFFNLIVCDKYTQGISVATKRAPKIMQTLEIDTNSQSFRDSYKILKANYDLFIAMSDEDKLKMEMKS